MSFFVSIRSGVRSFSRGPVNTAAVLLCACQRHDDLFQAADVEAFNDVDDFHDSETCDRLVQACNKAAAWLAA